MCCWVANFIPVPFAPCPSPKNHLITKQHEDILMTFLHVLHNIVQLSPTILVTIYFFTRIQEVDMRFPQFSKCEAWQKHLLLYMASPMSGQVKPNPRWSRVNFTWQFTYMISQVLPHGLSSLLHSKWKPKKLHALVLSNTPNRIKKLSINLLSKVVSWLKVFQIVLTRKLIMTLFHNPHLYAIFGWYAFAREAVKDTLAPVSTAILPSSVTLLPLPVRVKFCNSAKNNTQSDKGHCILNML